MTLEPGDLILTGTPSGVGPVRAGQTITAGLDDLLKVTFPVIERPWFAGGITSSESAANDVTSTATPGSST